MKFEINDEQEEKLNAWVEEQDNTRIAEMLKSDEEFLVNLANEGIPYYGVDGGALTYSFTPTSIGVVLVVRNESTKKEIDLTNYMDW